MSAFGSTFGDISAHEEAASPLLCVGPTACAIETNTLPKKCKHEATSRLLVLLLTILLLSLGGVEYLRDEISVSVNADIGGNIH